MEYQFKSKEYYEKNKKKFNRKHNMLWKSISYSPYVGNCSYLIHKYNPNSYEEFWEMYSNDYDNDSYMWDTCKGDPHRGRSIEQLSHLAEYYHIGCGDEKITFEQCLDDIINHVIVETFDGHIVERALRKKLEESNYTVEEMEDEWDTKYGIDIKIISPTDENYIRYIQVKPISFFLGNNNESLVKDRSKRFKTENDFKTMLTNYGKGWQYRPIEYMSYDKKALDENGTIKFMWLKDKNKFHLDEMVTPDGYTKINYNLISFKDLK